MLIEGTVQDGVVILDDGPQLPNGTRVKVETSSPASTQPPLSSLATSLLALAGKATGLPSDMARNHDHYIHGAAKR